MKYGPGQPVEVKVHAREGMSKESIKMAIDFATSEEAQQSVAYGTISMMGPDGVRTRVARNIRKRSNNALIKQITAILKENKMPVPADSTLRALFSLLPAGKVKEITGLDPKYEEHRDAYRRFEEILTELHSRFLGSEACERVLKDVNNVKLVEMVQQALKTSESYMMGYFIYHLAFGDPYLNHCVNLACNDQDQPHFSESCSNYHIDGSEDHPERCEYCDLLPTALTVLKDLIAAAPNLDPRTREIFEYDRKFGEKAILEYKRQTIRHYVGSQKWNEYFSEGASMQRVMATADFAMKWEAMWHKTTTTQHYGKRGSTYHGVAYERIVDTGKWPAHKGENSGPLITNDCHIQVVNNTTLQDSDTALALIIASLEDFKEQNPDVTEVVFKCDNAGCYHCWATIVRLWALRDAVKGIKIVALHFGQAGKGKDKCDKYFSFVRAHQRKCVMDKYDASTPKEFADNLCRYGGIANTTIQFGDVDAIKSDKKSLKAGDSEIPNISNLYEFTFESEGIRVRTLPGYGEGKLYIVDPESIQMQNIPKFHSRIVNGDNLDENLLNKRKTTYHHQEDSIAKTDVYGETSKETKSDPKDIEQTTKDDDKIFFCSNVVCGKAFLRPSALLNHESDEKNCVVRDQTKQSSKNYAREYYISKNGISKEYRGKSYKDTRNMIFHKGALPAIDKLFLKLREDDPEKYGGEDIKPGHALQGKKVVKQKSQHLRDYLDKIFKEGNEEPGKRKQAADVAKLLRLNPEMTQEDWLTVKQIKSYFSNAKAEKIFETKEPTQEEIDEGRNTRIQTARTQLVDYVHKRLAEGVVLENDCPITSEGINLCVLAQSIKACSDLSDSKIEDVKTQKLKKALKSLGITEFGGPRATKSRMAGIVVKYVEDHCDCLMV